MALAPPAPPKEIYQMFCRRSRFFSVTLEKAQFASSPKPLKLPQRSPFKRSLAKHPLSMNYCLIPFTIKNICIKFYFFLSYNRHKRYSETIVINVSDADMYFFAHIKRFFLCTTSLCIFNMHLAITLTSIIVALVAAYIL